MNEALRKELGEYRRLFDQLEHTRWRVQKLVSESVEFYFPEEEVESCASQETAIDGETSEGEELLHVIVEFKKCDSADLDKLHLLQQALGANNMKVSLANFSSIPIDEKYVPRLHLDFYLPILVPFQ